VTTAPGASELLARRVGAGEGFFDYTRFPYEPVRGATGKWSSSFVLEAALDAAGADALKEPIRALGGALGLDATVWGAKHTAAGYSWELYFYDYSRADPRFRVDRVLDAIGAVGPTGPPAPPIDAGARRHFMFSVDVSPAFAAADHVAPVHFYFYDVGDRMTGISYGYGPSGWALENHYAFYDPRGEMEPLREKVADSPRLGAGNPVEVVLVPQLVDCRRVCVANKPTCDGVYFSGVHLDQFIQFLESFGHPAPFVAALRDQKPALDHMLYDVAFDYRATPTGELQVLKTGFYGTA
jgi:hypothetical protein